MLTYLVLFAWSFLAATILPIGSEPMLVGVVRSGSGVVIAVAIATAGNFLGACTLYWMGRRAGKLVEAKFGRSVVGSKASGLLARYGKPILALSWVPLLGDALIALAGAAGVAFGPFTGWVLAGKIARYAVVAWLALRLF
ncbi:MAG TPA: VTT domain-containing protein [Thermoanaerobaculia bacterium]|nr:VTT domain-containing protein [Thermoanaerobaculia bacterium]